MTETAASYRRILRTSSITGGASVLNILIGLVRTKAVALLLGPAGLGLISLYTGLMSTAVTMASLGVGAVGARQVAEAVGADDVHALAVVRRAMLWGTLVLALAGGLAVWALRGILADRLLGGAHADLVGWLAVGVALSVAAGSQGALIQGMRRIGDMARLSVFGAALNTVLGVAVLWRWGSAGLVAYVLIGPLVNFVLGHVFVSRLPRLEHGAVSLDEMAAQWKTLARLGVAFMGAGLAQTLVQLWIRVEVGDALGAGALGHYQAAWLISMQYVGFVLGAMGADYYPRLTAVIGDREAASRLINQQTEVALLISGPIFLAMTGLAPWVIHLLYSADFAPAVEVLRWQILGDVLKVASWPMGFVILAAGDGKTFFVTETLAVLLMGGLVAYFVHPVGLQITGIAFLACYLFLLPLVYVLAHRRIGFGWTSRVVCLCGATFVLCAGVASLSVFFRWAPVPALLLSIGFGLYAVDRIARLGDMRGPVGALAGGTRKLLARLGS